jgi:glycosyltransferase involved in cell wall biosynthesis
MEILMLTNVWTGARPFFYEGVAESKGMPAFNNVFLRLLKDSRVSHFHIIIWQPEQRIEIPTEYIDKITFYIIPKNQSGFLNNFKLIFNAIQLGKRIVKQNTKICKIIGFGSLGGITSIISKLVKIPDFRRLYGTFLINEISRSKLTLFLKHPLEYLTFASKGKGLLVTNDGTKGDVVYNKIGTSSLPFYFPLNGVDKKIINNIAKPDFELPVEYMIYVARLDPWKRQNLLLESLGILLSKGKKIPFTFIVGAIYDKNYVSSLQMIIEKYDLHSHVQLIYGLPINQVHYMLYHAKLTFSLYHTSNLGNVFIESMQLGVPIIAINDTGSLDLIDKTAYYELKNDNINEIANAIDILLANENMRVKLKNEAIFFANKKLISWEDRAKYEIDLFLE